MPETLTILKTRRSCRSFLPRPVAEDTLDTILEAGTWAASGKGKQSPIILAVTDRAMRDRLSALTAAAKGRDGDPFYGAPQVLVVLADRTVLTHVCDGSLVLGNMMLAAADLGVASCWVHRMKEVFESDEGRAILRGLGIEGDYEGIGSLAVGYAAAPPAKPAPRKANYVYRI